MMSIVACGNENAEIVHSIEETAKSENATAETSQIIQMEADEQEGMKLYINDAEIPVSWENNDAVLELTEQVKIENISINMSMYGDFEQVGALGRSYSTNDKKMTTQNGDIVLYNGNQLVLFYGSNSWSYTRLGKIELPERDITELLSNGNVTITIQK